MSTKYPWLATNIRTEDLPSNNPFTSLLTDELNVVAPRPNIQRVAIPTGWQKLLGLLTPASGILVRLCSCFMVIGVTFFWTTPAVLSTAQAQVIINEIHPAPDAAGTEWIELYNNSSTDISIAGWKIYDAITTPSLVTTIDQTLIPANGYVKVSWSASKLNNSGDSIILFDANNNLYDEASYTSSQVGKSWSRLEADSGFEWQLSDPTPGKTNETPLPAFVIPEPLACVEPTPTHSPVPSPSVSPSPTASVQPSPSPSASPNNQTSQTAEPYDIYISSVMACPLENQQEWVEVFNSTNQTLNTDGWYITDAAQNKRFLLSDSAAVSLSASTFTKITFGSSFINNSGETLYLHAADGQITQTIDLPSCDEKGIAFTQENGSWQQTTTDVSDSVDDNASESTTTQTDASTTAAASANNEATQSTTTNITAAKKPSVLGSQTQQQLKKPTLNIPEETTNTFKAPVQLLAQEQPYFPVHGILALILGGTAVTASSGYKLLTNLGILM